MYLYISQRKNTNTNQYNSPFFPDSNKHGRMAFGSYGHLIEKRKNRLLHSSEADRKAGKTGET